MIVSESEVDKIEILKAFEEIIEGWFTHCSFVTSIREATCNTIWGFVTVTI